MTDNQAGFHVVHATSHRNGVAGAPFHVAIVQDDEAGRMLVIDFSYPDSGAPDGYTAVLNLDMAAQGNIYMHQQLDEHGVPVPDTGDNAWRGDVLGDQYRHAIADHIERWHDAQMAAWRRVNEKKNTDTK